MKLSDFIVKNFGLNLVDAKVTLNNQKNDFDPMLNLRKLQNGTLSEQDYSNTVAWIGQRNAQLFKVGSYIIQLVQETKGVKDIFILGSIAKVISCVKNPNFIEKNDTVKGEWVNDFQQVVPYEEDGNHPNTRYTYKLERVDLGPFIGMKVKINFKRTEAYQLMLSKVDDDLLIEPMANSSINKFPGYNKINHSFKEMKSLINLPEWRTALEHQKGIYMLLDMKTGKQYVGSAYGERSLWQRWSCYLETGHGNDKGLIPLGKDYIMDNFKMIVLERCLDTMSNDEIIQHESDWKEKFQTRIFGYNEN